MFCIFFPDCSVRLLSIYIWWKLWILIWLLAEDLEHCATWHSKIPTHFVIEVSHVCSKLTMSWLHEELALIYSPKLLSIFLTYLLLYRTCLLENGLPKWGQILTQLRFIHNWVIIMGIAWMDGALVEFWFTLPPIACDLFLTIGCWPHYQGLKTRAFVKVTHTRCSKIILSIFPTTPKAHFQFLRNFPLRV